MRLDMAMATLLRDQRLAGISAIAAFAVFTAGNLLWALDQPAPDARGAELVDFYKDSSGRIVAGGSLSLVSIAILVVLAAALSRVLEALLGDDLLAKVVFGGLVLGCAAGLGAESINMAAAIRADDGALTEPLAEALFDVSYMFGSYAAGVGFGLATAAIGLASLQSRGLLPRWLAGRRRGSRHRVGHAPDRLPDRRVRGGPELPAPADPGGAADGRAASQPS